MSEDRHSTYAVLTLAGGEDEREAGLEQIEAELTAPGLETQIGGGTTINRDINEQVSADIARAEIDLAADPRWCCWSSSSAASRRPACRWRSASPRSSVPSPRCAAFTYVTDVSIFAVNIVTIIGLGLAIDYGLFMVSRFREEIRPAGRTRRGRRWPARWRPPAGRWRSPAITVAISLAGLLIFPQVFLRSMGFGGMSAVLIAMLAALTLLPALLAMLGPKVDALSVRPWLRRVFRRARRAPTTDDHGAWYRIAQSVMRRPVVYTVVVVAVLVALALPFLRVQFGGIDERVLPAGTESRVVTETIDGRLPARTRPVRSRRS